MSNKEGWSGRKGCSWRAGAGRGPRGDGASPGPHKRKSHPPLKPTHSKVGAAQPAWTAPLGFSSGREQRIHSRSMIQPQGAGLEERNRRQLQRAEGTPAPLRKVTVMVVVSIH